MLISEAKSKALLKPGFHIIVFDVKIVSTETFIWKRSSQTTEAILAIETILAYGSSEIELESISDDPYARIVSILSLVSI